MGNGSTTTSKTPVQLTSPTAVTAGAQPTFSYNGDGLRTSKTSAGTTLNYAWDQSTAAPLLLTDGKINYIYGAGGAPIEQIDASGNVQYFHQDQLGSTRLLTDSAGNVTASYSYDSYGNITARTGTEPGLGSAETGLVGDQPFIYRVQTYDRP